ncbi:MAG: 16S rRNA (guanine(527)-N(7))-methyltransferase RsmG [Eubacteriales bacterium]|nr:16S rRNA (guanine(527)-N(7))-methyltransferase RsmG [Eubacteriales bacterium]MDD3073355.1 16S rRNA (guanine(527)-N(7))-methyltransferase RsmG [Eubacteriales bacterium]MDD4078984.1 16S rRNA (guanine(527)-N(7))-methyltransferase RsmG [Eubacteriales bacterium]MDD4768391.1 16S rRNA (guanine(527)-N(7))-methyltransferase RsmG [Eubacteriales bacterium]
MRTELEQVLAENGFPHSSRCLDQLCQYYQILVEWNKKINLTALIEPRDFIYKHICDSLFPGKFIALAASSLVDIGTGAGFPGLPLKIVYPEIKLTLVEAAAKKAAFLRHCCQELAVEADILWERAENLGQGRKRETFSLTVTRAVAGLSVICEYCLPLLALGGCCLAMKGPGGAEEAAAAENALRLLGGQVRQVHFYSLPPGDQRSLVVIDKIRPTPSVYPRRPGMPAKKPL